MRNPNIVFHSSYAILHSYQKYVKVLIFPHLLQYFCLCDNIHTEKCEMKTVVLIYIFSMASDIEYLVCLYQISITLIPTWVLGTKSLDKWLFKSLDYLFQEFLLLSEEAKVPLTLEKKYFLGTQSEFIYRITSFCSRWSRGM